MLWVAVLVGGCGGSPPPFPEGAGDTSGPPRDGTTMPSSSDGDMSTTDTSESSTGCELCDADVGTTLELAESSGTSSASTTTSGASETTGSPDDPYSPCPGGENEECPEGETCTAVADLSMILGSSCGAPRCSKVACPAPPSGNAVPICVGSGDTCVLDCEGGRCPVGMECMTTNVGHVCMWPA